MDWRIVYAAVHGLVLAYFVWLTRKFVVTGRAPIWNGFFKTYYVERAEKPVTFWCMVAAYGVIDIVALSFVANDLAGGAIYPSHFG